MRFAKLMKSSLSAWMLATLCLAGCGGAGEPAVGAEVQSLSTLPPLPGCEGLVRGGAITTRPLAGGQGLVVVYSDGQPQCIDASDSPLVRTAARSDSNPMPGYGSAPTANASSNPMPGLGSTTANASSNPMPGQPTDPASSNPMPGLDPLVTSDHAAAR